MWCGRQPKNEDVALAAIETAIRTDYERLSQLAQRVLAIVDEAEDKDIIFRYLLENCFLHKIDGPPSQDPIIPKQLFNTTAEKLFASVSHFLNRLHEKNPPSEQIGTVLREWLDIKFPAGKNEDARGLERTVAVTMIMSFGSQRGFIPYRQLPANYKINQSFSEEEEKSRKLRPLLGMIRRVAEMDDDHDWISQVALHALNSTTEKNEQLLLIKNLVFIMRDLGAKSVMPQGVFTLGDINRQHHQPNHKQDDKPTIAGTTPENEKEPGQYL